MLSVASILLATLQSIFIMAVVCITTLPPVSSSRVEPFGMLTSFASKTVSFVSVSLVSETS